MQRIMETEAAGMEEEVMHELEDALPDSFRRMREAENPSSFFEALPAEEQKEVADWRERHQQARSLRRLRQKAMDERLRGMDGIDRRVRRLITLRVACVCPHTDTTPTPNKSRKGDGAPSAAAAAAAAGGKAASSTPAPRGRRGGARARGPGGGEEFLGRRSGLPPILAVVKVWAPNEATAGLLLEGAVLRLHSVTASVCRQRVPGCSLELSAGRQTKIEVIGTTTTGGGGGVLARPPADEGGHDLGGERTPFFTPRFVPRRYTPLSALVPPPLRGSRQIGNGEGGCWHGHLRGGGGSGSGSASDSADLRHVHGGDEEEERGRSTAPPSAAGGGGGEAGDGSAAGGVGVGGGGDAEVDVVGCVFAVTVDCSPLSATPGSGEVFATVESIMHAADSACRGGGGSGGGGSGFRDESGNERNSSTTAQADDERVTYRVYMTEPSGACAVLTKRVRPELARHHRILRSAPGACWAIVNAGRHNGGGAAAAAGGAWHPSAPGGLPTIRDRGLGALSWSSLTAAGGNGSAPPPRSVGGAPARHLGRPLLAARRWAEGDEGRNAVRRERQRLEILQARERRRLLAVTPPSMVADAGGLPPGAAAAAAAAATAGDAGASLSGRAEALEAADPMTDAAAPAAVASQTTPGSPCRERALLLKRRIDDAVIGFVSSFAVLPGFPPLVVAAGTRPDNGGVVGGGGGGVGDTSMPGGLDLGCLWMGIDTGGGLAAAVLPRASLKELLDVALGGGNGGRSLRPAARVPDEPGTSGNAETTGTSSDDIARAFLDRAVAVAAAAPAHDDETCRREGGGRSPMRAAGSADSTVGDGAPAARLAAAAQLAAGQQPKRPAPPLAPPNPPPVTDFDDAIAPADGGIRSRGGEVVASREAVLPGVLSTKAGPSERRGESQQRPPHSAVVSSDGEAAIIDALASALCRMAHPSRRQGLGCSGSAGGGPFVRRNVSPAAAIEGDVTAPPFVAAGLAESPPPGAAVSDVKPSADCSTVAGPATADGSGINLGSRGFSDVKAADAGGVTSAAPSVADGDGGGGGGGCRRGVGGGDATGAILDDLASACGRKQLSFSVSRFFSRGLGRDVAVVDRVGSVDVARSAEALLNDFGGAGAGASPRTS
ncbi:unnamed protein product [Ectocarpus sp. 12 AP-2014]